MTFKVQAGVRAHATFGRDKKTRFFLAREWNPMLPRLAACMVNASRADSECDDPSVRKMQSFARSWGFGSVSVVNVFPLVATNPKELRGRVETAEESMTNLQFILSAAERCDMFVCAWGRNGLIEDRADLVLESLRRVDLYAIRLLKDGTPEHPLYLPGNLKPVLFRKAATC